MDHMPIRRAWILGIQQTILACQTASILVIHVAYSTLTGVANAGLVRLGPHVATVLQPPMVRLLGPGDIHLHLGLHSFACLMSCPVFREISAHACNTNCMSYVGRCIQELLQGQRHYEHKGPDHLVRFPHQASGHIDAVSIPVDLVVHEQAFDVKGGEPDCEDGPNCLLLHDQPRVMRVAAYCSTDCIHRVPLERNRLVPKLVIQYAMGLWGTPANVSHLFRIHSNVQERHGPDQTLPMRG